MISQILRCRFSGCALVALVLSPVTLVAASANRPTTPVTVEDTVSIQGGVEVLNDLLYQPFAASVSSATSTSPTASIDIPDGKRLVVEFVSFQASTPTGTTSRIFFQPQTSSTSRLFMPLPIQFTSVEGGATYYLSGFPLKLRIDSVPGSTSELQVRRGTGSDGTISLTVTGYLIDL